jgi:hypothetical protein
MVINLKQQKKMRPTYLKDGEMANSKFDTSLLKPVKSNKKKSSGWDPNKLKPVGEEKDPGAYLDTLEDESSFPTKRLRDVVSGIGAMQRGLFNQPYDLVSNLESQGEEFKKSLPQPKSLPPEVLNALQSLQGKGSPKISESIPHQSEINFPQFFGQKGENSLLSSLIQGGLEYAPDIYLGGSLAKKLLRKPFEKIKELRQFRPLKEEKALLEAEQEKAGAKHGEAETEYNALKDFLESKPGFKSSNPNVLERKAGEAKIKADLLRQESEAVPEHLRAEELPEHPETTPLSIVEPVKAELEDINAIPKTEINDARIKKAESLLKSDEEKLAEHEQNINTHLGEGNAHRKRVAQKLNPILEKRQAEVGKEYTKYLSDLKDKNIALSNPRNAKQVTADINKAIKEGGYGSEEVQNLAKELEKVSNSKGEIIPAHDFVNAYRTLRQFGQKIRSSAYGKDPKQFDELIAKADSIDADVERMKAIIDKGLGKENLTELNRINHRYATEIAPLFKNKFFQHLQTKNKAPTNMIEQLSNEPFIKSTNPNKVTGSQILKDIIKNDPELLQNVIGERFAGKPGALHEWDEAAHEYIQHLPELQKMRQQHFEAQQNVSRSKMNLEKAKNEHKLEREEAAKKDQERIEQTRTKNAKAKEKALEQTRLKKAEVDKENKRKKHEHAAKTKFVEIQKELKELDETHANLLDSASKFREKASRKDISLKEKLSVEAKLKTNKERLDKVEKDIAKLKKTGKGLFYGGVGLFVGTSLFDKAKKLFGD